MRRLLFTIAALLTTSAAAEQFRAFDDVEVHYVVINTLFLQPDVAASYHIERGSDRAIVNVSVLRKDGTPLTADLSGTAVNLLNHEMPLEFGAVEEEQSIYYIAPLRYTDQDVLRFRINVVLPGRAPMSVEFQQQMYVERDP